MSFETLVKTSIPRHTAEVPVAVLLGFAMKHAIGKRFSNLILPSFAQVDFTKSFASLGVDSMIASEFSNVVLGDL